MGNAVPEPPDEVLVMAAILGDLEAFGDLAERYRAAAVRTAQAIVGREDAEDVAQDAHLLAF
jgi:DNA-directed RNA polymerase specialized sigma24 family protein